MAQLENVFPVNFDEDEVRRLCGAAVFGRADALQRAGHVYRCAAIPARLSAEVRGTWRRLYPAAVLRTGGRLVPSCECGAGGFCPHTSALLLQVLRAPRAFRARTQAQ